MLEAMWAVFAAAAALNVWATWAILRDSEATAMQWAAQCAVVWLVPLIGAILTLYLKREPAQGSGKYREIPDAGDDYGHSGRAHRKNMEALDHTPGGSGHTPD